MQLKSSQGKFNTLHVAPLNVLKSIQWCGDLTSEFQLSNTCKLLLWEIITFVTVIIFIIIINNNFALHLNANT